MLGTQELQDWPIYSCRCE